jgi:hypothetical protein
VRRVVSELRGYWTAVLLGVAALVLLLLGAPTKAALAGVGFAFIGAALTRAVDVAKEHRAAAAQADAERRRDLDETRRLAYMALDLDVIPHAELNSTLINALVHHGLETDRDVATEHIGLLLSPTASARHKAEARDWVFEQIERITDELGK